MGKEPGPLSVASTAAWAAALLLAALVGLDFYLASQGVGALSFKARREAGAVYLEAPVRNTGFLPLSLEVDLGLCGHTYRWSGELPPGGGAVARLKVDPEDLACKPRWRVVIGLGGIVSAEVLPAQG